MKSGSIRAAMGISRERVARWAGVSETLVVIYEANPTAVVGDKRRGAIAHVYAVLTEAHAKLTRRAGS